MMRFALARLRRLGSYVAILRLLGVASLRGLRLHVNLAPGAYVSPRVQFECAGVGRARLVLAEGSRIEAGALLKLGPGADIRLGKATTVRSGVVLNVTGCLTLAGENLLSWNSVVHCATSVTMEFRAGTGEMVTIVDGAHFRNGPDDHWYQNTAAAPVTIGANVWLASKSTVARGVVVGAGTTVSANSVVTRDLPSDCLAAGNPAEIVRRDINQPRG